MSYKEAVTLLGRDDNRFVTLAGHVASGAIFAGAVLSGGAALTLLDAKNDLVRWGHETARAVSARRRGLAGRDRSEVLVAAHAVIVMTAYLEALDACSFGHRGRIGDGDILRLIEALSVPEPGHQTPARRHLTIDKIARRPVPHPHAGLPYEQLVREVEGLYRSFNPEVLAFLRESVLWDKITESDRLVAGQRLSAVVTRASALYQGYYFRLAADCPEFFFWANLQDSAATRDAIQRADADLRARLIELAADVSDVRHRLAAIPRLLELAGVHGGGHAAASLNQLATAEFAAPIAEATVIGLPRVRLPSIGAGYVNPSGRIASRTPDRRVADERWWRGEAFVGDLQRTLVAALIGPDAAEVPTVVLGEPGAGKSLLTKVLAASLAQAGVLVVRVELRRVDAGAPIQKQIEEAVVAATGERVTWPELTRSAPDAYRVVLIDGFDELLQATDVGAADYLEKVRAFQVREQQLGRPVAVVVTSRTIVAHRMRYPDESQIIRLEPFDDTQIALWIDGWNEANESHGVSPLSRQLVPPDLARQPLLLLMLALYAAEGSTAPVQDDDLARGAFYRMLLTRFVAREVAKLHPGLTADELDALVDDELVQLAVVAFAIFNRGRQNVPELELDRDLRGLGLATARSLAHTRRLVGRFFFVHEARVQIGGRTSSSYEFLHASFGEYLIAWLVARTLARAADGSAADADVLRAVLSFAPLVTRRATVAFARDEFSRLSSDERRRLRFFAMERLFEARAALDFPSDYAPVDRAPDQRRAAYEVNLLVLALAADAGPVDLTALLEPAADARDWWRRQTLAWKALLGAEAWRDFADTLVVERADDGTTVRARVRLAVDRPPEPDDGWMTVAFIHQYLRKYRSSGGVEVSHAVGDLWLHCELQVGDLINLMGLGHRH